MKHFPPWKTVLIARQALFRGALAKVISLDERFKLIAETETSGAARDLCLVCPPDLVVVEVDWQRVDEFDLIRLLQKRFEDIRFLAVPERNDAMTLNRIHESGVHGCVSMDEPMDIFEEAMCEVASGANYFPAAFHETVRRLRADPQAFSKILTSREQQILWHVASGLTSRSIAARLNIGLRSVETYRYRLMKKLEIRNLAGLIEYAFRHGIAPLQQPIDRAA
jgi:two-component system invasion response regulator UvrY